MLSSEEIKQIGEEVGKVIEQNINPQFDSITQQFDTVNKQFDAVNQRLDGVETRLTKVEATMVTKDYLDEKLADMRGDLVVLMRKEDTKLRSLVDMLRIKNVLTDDDAKRLFTMEPFPQLI